MKPSLFDIVFTNNESVYFSGQTLQGHVVLELQKSTKVKDIRLVLHGKAFVHWTDQCMRGPGEIRLQKIRHHSANEVYFDISKSLLSQGLSGTIHNGEKRHLEAGQYTYPFQYHVPNTCPTSFEGQFGYIRYWVKVTIERPWKRNVAVKKIFTVICPLDLNLEPCAAKPVTKVKEKRLCCLCCSSGPITAQLRLCQKGYVPGESVFINAEINNSSRRKVDSASVELLMTTIFHTPHKSRSITQQVARVPHGSLTTGNSDSWQGERLVLPSLPPSHLIGCSVMEVKYTLELRVFPVGPAFELAVPLEIIVGTVPLRSTLERALDQQNLVTPLISQRGLDGVIPTINDNRLTQLISPTFTPSQMCLVTVHDDDDDQCFMLDNHYSPRYTTFNFQTMPQRRHHTVRFAT